MNSYLDKNRLKYQAFYRGCKENELLFRGFFERYFDFLDENELILLQEFVEIDDVLLLDYLYGRADFSESELHKTNKIFRLFMGYCLGK